MTTEVTDEGKHRARKLAEDIVDRAIKCETILEQIRAQGWELALHNSYDLMGKPRWVWLFLHPIGYWVRGDGATDLEAIQICGKQINGWKYRSDCIVAMKELYETVAAFPQHQYGSSAFDHAMQLRIPKIRSLFQITQNHEVPGSFGAMSAR